MTLTPHPQTPGPEIEITVEVERVNEVELKLIYRLFGDRTEIVVPAPADFERTDGLWKHTCFEAFINPAGREDYLELNFAPSGQWAAYRFTRYREGMTPANVEPSSTMGHLRSPLTWEVYVPVGRMARPDLPAPTWRLGLSAVIEETGGRISYWALAHPSDKPDFHHPDSFVLELP